MDYLVGIVGICACSAVIGYLSSQLSEEHSALKILMMFVSLFLLLFVPQVYEESIHDCGLYLNNTYTPNYYSAGGNLLANQTFYNYVEICANYSVAVNMYERKVPYQFYWLLTVFVIIAEIYLSIQFIRFILDRLGGLIK